MLRTPTAAPAGMAAALVAGFFMRGRMGGMPRFSIKDLMLAITLVATGIGLICFVVRCVDTGDGRYQYWQLLVCWWTGGALIGGGLFAPFKQAWIGAFIGLAIQFAYLAFGPVLT